MKISSVAALLAMAAAPAIAQSQPRPAAPAPALRQAQPVPNADKKSDSDHVVCEEEETIGSRLDTKTVCMTVSQWQAYQQDEQDQAAHIQAGSRAPGS